MNDEYSKYIKQCRKGYGPKAMCFTAFYPQLIVYYLGTLTNSYEFLISHFPS